MISISLNEYLNTSNPWTHRLLGNVDFKKVRDVSQIEREYNQDKYAKLAAVDLDSLEAYRMLELEQAGLPIDTARPIISKGDDLFEVSVPQARQMYYDLIRDSVMPFAGDRICELGCGYGYNLSLFDREVYGGEYSSNAVSIAVKLGLNVRSFNYYHQQDYEFIKPGTTVFTSHSIEQIPDAAVIIDNLRSVRDRVQTVIHIEPTVLENRTTLLGAMRNRYMELNDYNRNLWQVVSNAPDIEVLHFSADVFGVVPLNSSNVIAWRFKHA